MQCADYTFVDKYLNLDAMCDPHPGNQQSDLLSLKIKHVASMLSKLIDAYKASVNAGALTY